MSKTFPLPRLAPSRRIQRIERALSPTSTQDFMAKTTEQLRERIRAELDKHPDASTADLQEIARALDPAAGDLSLRQFNATYVLPVKRARKGSKGSKGGGRGSRRKHQPPPAEGRTQRKRGRSGERPAPDATSGGREGVRAVLLQFARDFSEAESRSQIVAVLGDLDRYVDQILKARG